jgi:sec-independent protein translocase protein TatB
MFGVGWTEMLVVGVVALIVIGPKDLPVVMKQLGKVVAMIRRMGGEFQRELNKTTGLDTITDLRRSITEPLRQTASEISREFNKTTSTGTVIPSGAIVPKDPESESVVDEIREKAGIAAPVMTAKKSVESPAPVEAIAPVEAAIVAKPRKPRAKKPAVAAAIPQPDLLEEAPPPKPAAEAVQVVAETPKPKKPAAPRKPRAAKPKAEA